MMMDERLLRQWIKECLVPGQVPDLLNESKLENDHFPGYVDKHGREVPSRNSVVSTAFETGKENTFYVFKSGTPLFIEYEEHEENPKKKKWKTHNLDKRDNLTLITKNWDEVTQAPSDLPGGATFHAQVQTSSRTGSKMGWIAISRIGHKISAKASETIVSDSNIGKMAEYVLARAISGTGMELDQDVKAAKFKEKYSGASDKDRATFRAVYEALYDASLAALGGLKNVQFTAASVPTDPNALVDVTATIARGGITRQAEIHVKYNDAKRKFGLQPGTKLKDNKTEKQYLVLSDDKVQVVHEKDGVRQGEPGSIDDLAGNPSSVIWKTAREEMWEKYIPPDIREDVVGGFHADKDTEFTMRSNPHELTTAWWDSLPDGDPAKPGAGANPRADYFSTLERWKYTQKLVQDIEKNFKHGSEQDSVLTIYAMFTATGVNVSLDIEAYDLQVTEDTPLKAVPIESDSNKLAMYNIMGGPGNKKNYFFIEFRSAGKGTGHPPQVKAGRDKLEMSAEIERIDAASASETAEVPAEETTIERRMRRNSASVIQEETMNNQDEVLIRGIIREILLIEAFTKTDEDKIGVLSRKEIDKSWKDQEKKVQALIDKGTKNAYQNNDFYKVVGKIWKELMKVYAEEQFQHARRFSRYDVPLARIKP